MPAPQLIADVPPEVFRRICVRANVAGDPLV